MCDGQAHCILLPDFIFENRLDQNVPSIFTSFFIYLYRINFSHIPFKFFTNEYFHKYSFVRLTYISLISALLFPILYEYRWMFEEIFIDDIVRRKSLTKY